MSNERKNVKITIDAMGEKTEVINCHGFAGVAFSDDENNKSYGTNVILVGNMSIKDLLAIHEAVQNKLVSLIEENIVDHTPNSVLLRALFGKEE